MELYKFINENEIKKYKGGFVVIDNVIFTNPSEKKVKEAGYKELKDADKPEYDEATKCLSISYKEADDCIEKVYCVVPLVENEVQEV